MAILELFGFDKADVSTEFDARDFFWTGLRCCVKTHIFLEIVFGDMIDAHAFAKTPAVECSLIGKERVLARRTITKAAKKTTVPRSET